MWRFDAAHTASSPEELPNRLHLRWTLNLPRPEPCWPTTEWRLQFDRSYEPVAVGNLVFLPSMSRDRVTAYDAGTGGERWRFYADGPVRFAPVVWSGTPAHPRPPRLYFVADDGCLYCLDATTGNLIWKFRGAPSPLRLLGNGRFISAWPARGAPVLHDGTVYFAAGIWPFMGIFLYAVDADTGRAVWTNSGDGQDFILQPHSSPAFAGVAPQGYLAVAGDKLLVAGGRSVPAAYARRTGAFLYFRAVTKNGGYAVTVAKDWFLNDGLIYRLADGKRVGASTATVVTGAAMIGIPSRGRLQARALAPVLRATVDRKGVEHKVLTFPILWQGKPDLPLTKVFLRAGSRLFCGGPGIVAAVPLPEAVPRAKDREVSLEATWQATIEGTPGTMIAANGRLFVVTQAGRMYCFSGVAGPPRRSPANVEPGGGGDPAAVDTARRLLDLTGAHDGYAVALDVRTGDLVEDLVKRSGLSVLAFAAPSASLTALRRRFDADGVYGRRLTLLPGEVTSRPLSPYFAGLVVTENPDLLRAPHPPIFWRRVFRLLRPYGGVACLPLPPGTETRVVKEIGRAALAGALVQTRAGFVFLRRPGRLPGAGSWTHQYGDAGNTVCSRDELVRSPLALLWFGGPHNVDVLPRHGHGPAQQIIGGRLFIEGIKVFSARDVYTGRVLWRKHVPDLDTFGMYYDKTYKPDPYDRSYNQNHIPGANQYGANFTSAEDAVYLLRGPLCLVLDPATGKTKKKFRLPQLPDVGRPNWGYASTYGDLLLVAAAPILVTGRGARSRIEVNARFGRGSKYLFVLNRHTGEVLWQREAVYNFRHNAIAAGGGKVFVIDRLSPMRLQALKRRGTAPAGTPRLLALDARTGNEVWTTAERVFGTWLSYSEERDVLLEAGSRAGDRAPDETGTGMSAYRGRDGMRLWRHEESYAGPPVLYHDWIITQTGGGNISAPPARAYNLLTGERVLSTHPLTADPVPWGWVRFKGCNTAVASEHLLTFRSAAGCYADLPQGYATTSIGGFKSGCTSNLIAADGVLNAPDYTRTCTCSYQNQADFALYHVDPDDPWSPDVESWCFTWLPAPSRPRPVRRVGLNFGATGDRLDPEGTLWLEVPSVGGPSPELPVAVTGTELRLFRRHSAALEPPLQQGAFKWVGASGIEGLRQVTVQLFLQPGASKQNAVARAYDRNAFTKMVPTALGKVAGRHPVPWLYTVRLYFCETEDTRPGERVFSVALQGAPVLTDFDPLVAAGGPNRTLVRQFTAVPIADNLRLDFSPSPGATRPPLLCGVELVAARTPTIAVGSTEKSAWVGVMRKGAPQP